jgi:6-phosphogluconolactonase
MFRALTLCVFVSLAGGLLQSAIAQESPLPPAIATRYAYIVDDNVVSIYTMNTKGLLRPDGFVPGDPLHRYETSAMDPLGRFFFGMTNVSCNAITVFSIASGTGLLSPISGSPFQSVGLTNVSNGALVITPDGKFAYSMGNEPGAVCNGHSFGAGITGFSIDSSTGALTQISGSPFSDGMAPLRGAVDAQGKFLFVSDNSNNISVFSIDSSTGALTPVSGSPFLACPTIPSCGAAYLTISPKNGNLYVLTSTMLLASFTVNPTTGFITEITGSPFGGFGVSPSGINGDPLGRFLYVSDGSLSSVLWVYAIDQQTGIPKIVPSSPIVAQNSVQMASTDPKGKFLYAPAFASFYTGIYKIPATGALTLAGNNRGPHGGWAAYFTSGAAAVKYLPTFAYVANSGSNSVSEYSIDSTGALTELIGSPFTDTNGPNSIAVTSAGTFLYAVDANHKVSAYSVGGSGSLTSVPGSPFSGFTKPTAVVPDPSNTYLFVVDAGTSPSAGTIWMEKIGSNGALSLHNTTSNSSNTPVAATMPPGSDFLLVVNSAEKKVVGYQVAYASGGSISGAIGSAATGNSPSAIAAEPSNNFIYVTNSGDGTVSSYKISDGNDGHFIGTPVPIATIAAGTSPSAVVVEPSGKYVYVANGGGGNIFNYKILASGALKRLSGTYAAGSAPDSLSVSNDGKHLYVSNSASGSVSVFTIATTGALTAGSPATTGTAPSSIAALGTRQ